MGLLRSAFSARAGGGNAAAHSSAKAAVASMAPVGLEDGSLRGFICWHASCMPF
jgi:hypothetical protein